MKLHTELGRLFHNFTLNIQYFSQDFVLHILNKNSNVYMELSSTSFGSKTSLGCDKAKHQC